MITYSVSLYEAGSSTVLAPEFNGVNSQSFTKAFPALQANILQGELLATPYCPVVLCSNQLYFPFHLSNSNNRVETDGRGLFYLGNSFCVGKIRGTVQVDEGILIGGAGAFNWYHFVVEILPKAFLAQNLPPQFDRFPLLVPEECQKIPSFSLALAYYSRGRTLHFICSRDIVSIKRLVILDEVNISPFNLKLGEWPKIEDYSQHDAVFLSFVADFRRKVRGDNNFNSRSDRRIFLTRPGVRRSFNQNELLEIAKRYGFESLSPDDLSLSEQAIIFSESAIVVGPSGAAWVGMIFQERPLRGLTWLPCEFDQFCSYSSLANLLGHKLDFIDAKTTRHLASAGDAYSAEYHVCAIQFESTLVKIIGMNK